MKTEIQKERVHLFSPGIYIAVKFNISGLTDTDKLKSAVTAAVLNNGILNCKIQMQDDGSAYYIENPKPNIPFCVSTQDWRTIIKQQEHTAFDLENGELIRFTAISQKDQLELLLIAHHLAGDGLSISYLTKDIISALNGEVLTYKPLQIYNSSEHLCRLNPFLNTMIKLLNHSWNKQQKVFTFKDYDKMYRSYWSNRETEILTCSIPERTLTSLRECSKQHQITLNSTITTAFIMASPEKKSDVGIAASIRPSEYEGMGNYATGISIQYHYHPQKTFWENAKIVHSLIYDKLNNPLKKYFLLEFMGKLSPTLIDAAYFAAYDHFKNKAAQTTSSMFGYQSNPKSISITNLTNLNIPSTYGNYTISDFLFIPPLVPNGKRVIGLAALDNTLSITMHTEKNKELPFAKQFFNQAIQELLNQASN